MPHSYVMTPPGDPGINTVRACPAGSGSGSPPPLLMAMAVAFVADIVTTVCGKPWKSNVTRLLTGTTNGVVGGVNLLFVTTTVSGSRLVSLGHASVAAWNTAGSPPSAMASDPIIP